MRQLGGLVVVEDENEEKMKKYEILFPSDEEWVNLDHSAKDDGRSFYMYRVIFMELRIRHPFSSFQMGVLNFLRVRLLNFMPMPGGSFRLLSFIVLFVERLCTFVFFLFSHFFLFERVEILSFFKCMLPIMTG